MAGIEVLSVTSEVYPLIKTGGLADVAGALPLALGTHGVSVRTLVPGYPAVMKALGETATLRHYDEFYGGPTSILRAEVAGLDLLVLDAPHLFDRPGGPYADPATGRDWPDNWRRFAALSKAGALLAQGVLPDYAPDLVHVHDWQAALTLAYLRFGQQPAPPSVITVHNLAFQGQFGQDIFAGLGLPYEALGVDGVEYYGGIGYLKAGLRAATAITTVSPTYAQEIRTSAFGMGLDGLVNTRAADLYGIVNGIDPDVWNPATDRFLAATYTPTTLPQREKNRSAIAERFGLAEGPGPVLGVVSRLTWQKGMDILASQLDGLVAAGARLAVLGSGDPSIEQALQAGAARHPGRVGVVIGYDEGLSHLIQGGTDVMLVPSRFEPCGLTQLYGLRYGCVPAVARTGGLADTVIDANEAALAAGVATGFQFAPDNAGEFLYCVRRIVEAFADPKTWAGIMRQGMKADVSWDRSAARYAALYRSLLPAKTAPLKVA